MKKLSILFLLIFVPLFFVACMGNDDPPSKIRTKAFENFNNEAKKEAGFLTEIQSPLNDALNNWGIEIDFSISSIAADDIVKNLISCSFILKLRSKLY